MFYQIEKSMFLNQTKLVKSFIFFLFLEDEKIKFLVKIH